MRSGQSTRQRRVRRGSASGALIVGLALFAGACGGSSDAGPTLSAAGERGKRIGLSSGCAGCHGTNGQGGVGPTWVGLAGSERELQDGTTVVADDAYLVRAIAEPGADLLADYRLQMPQNRLTGDDIADVIAYIKDLSQPVGG
jgi:mono/diheme cytochrome c family protein